VPLSEIKRVALAWAVGTWVSDPMIPPLLPQEDTIFTGTAESFHNFSQGCGTAGERAIPLSQHWRPTPELSPYPFPRWSRASVCAAIGGSNVVLVGDSLTGEFFDTLASSLAYRPDYGGVPRTNRCYVRRVCGGPNERAANVYFVNTATFVQDDAFGNEFSEPPGLQGLTGEDLERAGGQGCPNPPSTDGYMKRQSWKEQLAWAIEAPPALPYSPSLELPHPASPPPPPIIVANTGAHYMGNDQPAIDMVLRFWEYVRVLSPSALKFYRSTPRGHPYCDSPGRRNGAPLSAPLPDNLFDPDTSPYGKFFWQDFYSFTRGVAVSLPEDVVFLDVDNATALRADSHPFRVNPFTGTPGVSDCLHYCIPGPIDQWVHLWGSVLRFARIGLQEVKAESGEGKEN